MHPVLLVNEGSEVDKCDEETSVECTVQKKDEAVVVVDATVQLRAAMPEAAADRVDYDRQTLLDFDAHERRSSRVRRYQQRSITTTARARRGAFGFNVLVPKGTPEEDHRSDPSGRTFNVGSLVLHISIFHNRH